MNLKAKNISKKKIVFSLLFLPLTSLLALVIMGAYFVFTNEDSYPGPMDNIVFGPLYVVIITAVIWVPIMIAHLSIELISMRKQPSFERFTNTLLVESGLISLLMLVIFHDMETQTVVLSLLTYAGSQLLRWIYINRKGIKTTEL